MTDPDISQTAIDPPSHTGGEIPEDPRIVEVVQSYLGELEQGKTPDRRAYLNRYPELAQAIAQCLDGLELVHGGFPISRSRSGGRGTAQFTGAELGTSGLPNPLGDFQVVRELARGGMGIVYEAVQLSLGRRVALKVLPFAATFDARQLQRFKNEAHAAALLHHTHIVPIYAVGCERGVHFYAMQLIDGESLAGVIRQLREQAGHKPRGGAPSEVAKSGPSQVVSSLTGARSRSSGDHSSGGADTLIGQAALHSTVNVSASLTAGTSVTSESYFRKIARLMLQAAEALEHAHQQGLVHRDIKPANLLVNSAGNLWVTDFGLALFQTDTGLTRSGDVLGTFRYMSPEQTSGGRTVLDHRTDIYSLGSTFYELLTLEPVFNGETRQDLLYQILHDEPRPLRARDRSIPKELETIVLKALSKSPADRYSTAAAFAGDIQRYLEHQPIQARPPTLVDRGRKWSRRHPGVVGAGILLLTVTAILLFISNRWIRHEQQRTADALGEVQQQFRQARQAVDVLFQVSEEELADKPNVQGTRKRLLEIVLSYYQDFIDQHGGDAASLADLEKVQDKAKGILHELNVLQREMHSRLLTDPAVQQDLRLVGDQKERLEPLLERWSARRREIFENSRELTDEQRRPQLVALAEEHERALGEILTAAQFGRLTQIAIQTQGLFAFKEPEIVQALSLTSAQRARIRAIETEMFARGHRERHHGPGERPGGPRFDMREAVATAVASLTEEQARKWRELTGPEFAGFNDRFPPLGGPQRGPPGGPPGGRPPFGGRRPENPPVDSR